MNSAIIYPIPVASRKYSDLSGAGRALDVVGERWALLVVRELLLGPKRFGDLRSGLGGVSQNVLSQRLKQLETDDVVRRVRLGPPLSTPVYELTELGRGLEPALVALSRWGARIPAPEGATMSPAAYALMLSDLYRPATPAPTMRVRLLVDGDALDIDADEHISVRRADAYSNSPTEFGDRDVVITGTVEAIHATMFGQGSWEHAIAAGEVDVRGDAAAAQQFFASFALPDQAQNT